MVFNMQPFQEVLSKVWFIPAKVDDELPYPNALFINDRKKLLIDTGVGRNVIKRLLKAFGQPDIIFYSHAHEDHISESGMFESQTRFIHKKDLLTATSKQELYRIYGIETPEIREAFDRYFRALNYSPLKNLQTFEDRQIYDLGEIEVKIIHAPGHSAGHTVFEIVNQGLIYTSDIDLSSFGPWYGGLDGDVQDFKNSINKVRKLSPKILISCHQGLFKKNIDKKLEKSLKIIEEREQKLLNFLAKPKSLTDLVGSGLIYQEFPTLKEIYVVAERIMIEKHLKLFLKEGRIEKQAERYQRVD